MRVVPVGGDTPPTSFFREIASDDVRRLRSTRLSDEEQDEQQRVDEILRAASRYDTSSIEQQTSMRGTRFSLTQPANGASRQNRLSAGFTSLISSVLGGGEEGEGGGGRRSVSQSPARMSRPQSPGRGSGVRVPFWAGGSPAQTTRDSLRARTAHASTGGAASQPGPLSCLCVSAARTMV